MKNYKLNLASFLELIPTITKLLQSTGKTYRLTLVEWKEKRSLTANAQANVWYPIIAEFYGEDTEFIRKWMKHSIGWPILERGGCEYSVNMRWMLEGKNYSQRSVDDQIKMVEMFKVTSIMNSAQHTMLRDEIQIFWAKQGLELRYLNG